MSSPSYRTLYARAAPVRSPLRICTSVISPHATGSGEALSVSVARAAVATLCTRQHAGRWQVQLHCAHSEGHTGRPGRAAVMLIYIYRGGEGSGGRHAEIDGAGGRGGLERAGLEFPSDDSAPGLRWVRDWSGWTAAPGTGQAAPTLTSRANRGLIGLASVSPAPPQGLRTGEDGTFCPDRETKNGDRRQPAGPWLRVNRCRKTRNTVSNYTCRTSEHLSLETEAAERV